MQKNYVGKLAILQDTISIQFANIFSEDNMMSSTTCARYHRNVQVRDQAKSQTYFLLYLFYSVATIVDSDSESDNREGSLGKAYT